MRANRLAWIAALACGALVVARMIWLAMGGEDRIVATTPDDSFYYFVLAKNFAATGVWTFDGVAATSGFHLLWGYLLAGVFWLAPGLDATQLMVVSGTIAAVALGYAAWVLTRLLTPVFGWGAWLAVLMVLGGGAMVVISTMAMETILILPIAAILAKLAFSAADDKRAIRICALTAAAGLAGMMVRSDFGLMAAAILVGRMAGEVAPARLGGAGVGWREAMRTCLPAACGLGGAVAGLALVVMHTLALTGEPLQDSARIKSHLSEIKGHDLAAAFRVALEPLLNGLGQTPTWLRATLVAGLVGAAWWRLRGAQPRVSAQLDPAPGLGLWLAGVIAFAGYVLVYSRNSGLQIWYQASFAAPMLLMLAPLAGWLGEIVDRRGLQKAAAVICVVALVAVSFVRTLQPIWHNQVAMRDAGLALRHPAGDAAPPVAAWNAGLVAFMSDRRVFNLDGLVNNKVYPFLVGGRLADYVAQERITHVADYDIMLSQPLAHMGGYADGRLAACMTPVADIRPDIIWRDSRMRIYAVDAGCLAK